MLLSNLPQLEQAETPIKYSIAHPGEKGPTTRNRSHQRPSLPCRQHSWFAFKQVLGASCPTWEGQTDSWPYWQAMKIHPST